MFRPIYEDDSINLNWDKSLTAAANGSITATNTLYVGASNYTICIPRSATGLLFSGGGVTAEVNSFNIADPATSGSYRFVVNKLLAQPTQGNRRNIAVNPSFSAMWVSVTSLNKEYTNFIDIPTRYVRLRGVGVTALTGGLGSASVWGNNFTQGV